VGLAGAVTPGSKSRGPHDHILLSHLRFPPTWRARSPYLYPPGTRWPSYTPKHWVPFSSPLMTRRDPTENAVSFHCCDCSCIVRAVTYCWLLWKWNQEAVAWQRTSAEYHSCWRKVVTWIPTNMDVFFFFRFPRTANPKALASILAPRSACQILATCIKCSSCL
jgi:hypothetical protein